MDSIWPEQLIKDLARRRTVIVIGSGVSKHAVASDQVTRPPIWSEFLDDAYKALGSDDDHSHIKVAIDDGDYLHACEWIKEKMDEDWPNFLRSKFVDPRYLPGEIHEVIALLDSRIVFSLNFDDIYENKSREINDASQFVKNYYDSDICEFLKGDARYIIKLHGSLSSPANLIFTQEEYSKSRIKNNLFYTAFEAALLSYSFLFIGCGYRDPDINLLLENQNFRSLPGNNLPHYFLTHKQISNDLKRSLRKNRNLKTICYDKIDDMHSGLTSNLKELVTLVNERREELRENINW